MSKFFKSFFRYVSSYVWFKLLLLVKLFFFTVWIIKKWTIFRIKKTLNFGKITPKVPITCNMPKTAASRQPHSSPHPSYLSSSLFFSFQISRQKETAFFFSLLRLVTWDDGQTLWLTCKILSENINYCFLPL